MGHAYIADVCPLHEFLHKITDFNYNPKDLFLSKDEIIEFEDTYKMYMDNNDFYLDEILDNTL